MLFRSTDAEIEEMILNGNILDNSFLLSLKYRNQVIENIPFVETIDVEITGNDSVRIVVYEKSLAGCVSYLGSYMYFDRDGIVVESSSERSVGVPEVTGLTYGFVTLYQQLPVENENIFKEILTITQLLDKYEVEADKIYFDHKYFVTLYFGQARVRLGDSTNLDEKIMQLAVIVPNIVGDRKSVV